MLPVLLCVVGWGWSVGHVTFVGYWSAKHGIDLCTRWGGISAEWATERDTSGLGWDGGGFKAVEHFWWPPEYGTSFLGFRFQHLCLVLPYPDDSYYVFVPYWFLIVIFGFILFLVWRKTRPMKSGQGFPVILATDKDKA